MKPDEIRKVQTYMRNTFKSPELEVRARPRKDDSAEVYIKDEFLGVIFRDEEDGELSWNFQMAILDIDVEGL
ncbi:hypothetical protein PsW64_02946 [Pseudovibrio sp. W64]|uniref:DUF3126 family protein n=1 Tax=unclassified Pseudovibrio TaxID=2627060 RepID=UPI0007AE6128|nr:MULTISPECIES: DUF3126 family protein [unclassified Pseudovibrio]KZK77550.1 hypothetical protein PsAD46_04572 [Pseudovibrio sp. Ad46]KZK79323.1 hypothetical protein PsW64_02946 [Pseudovibrio sp. W64]KZK81276.1 hypothetical protein PsAD13_04226 [Pseudovibrio sp. Ad13]KZK93420.1 hypothetical protein PsAD5_03136 [Pseudovibrio sp. Ad5]KZK94569.1 hypothetical protein PsW74_04575 [Pseudovibrio sp. W74]